MLIISWMVDLTTKHLDRDLVKHEQRVEHLADA
jgi:hypothetical protein